MIKPTVEELRIQAQKEIPYEHGRGSSVLAKRTRRHKELMREQGYPLEVPKASYTRRPSGQYAKQHPSRD